MSLGEKKVSGINCSKTGRLMEDKQQSTPAERVPVCDCASDQLSLHQH